MVTVRKVVHRLELLVDDTNASLVSTVDNLLDVLGTLAQSCELLVHVGGGLNGGLRVELGWYLLDNCTYKVEKMTTYQDTTP